ncbi:MAG: DNA mismatch repair endonuclease MutL [Spirochaetaceae bacterium]
MDVPPRSTDPMAAGAPDPSEGRPVHVLEDHVARKIAAGEVIDRPYSVVRELMDNALDAGATSIDVYVEQGGLRRISVRDDGWGMSPEDLRLCWRPHATSKVISPEDLERVRTLGFRGEALASVAEVARLRITSVRRGAETGNRLEVHGGELVDVTSAHGDTGTTVDVRDLFYAMPARRRFLKRPAAETAMVRTIFIEKALPFPERTFRLYTDGSLRHFLPASVLPTRIAGAFPDVGAAKALQEVTGSGEGFSFRILTTGPEYSRKDRKLIQTFVNHRRVWEYALVQAIEYGFSDYLPGGSHPVAFLFLDVDPSRVDVNIHPAKREVRFRNLPEIHRRITRVLQEFLRQYALRFPAATAPATGGAEAAAQPGFAGDFAAPPGESTPRRAEHRLPPREGRSWPEGPPDRDPARPPRSRPSWVADRPALPRVPYDLTERFDPTPTEGRRIRYLGQIFNLFLLAEYGDTLYIVDQHAGHEKVLFARFQEQTRTQSLLVPVSMEVSPEEDEILETRAEDLNALGIGIRRRDATTWELCAVPAVPGIDAEALAEALRELAATPDEVLRDLYATMSCKAAIKDGDPVDPATGRALLEEVFSLDNAHCPHGRPVWHEITREELFRLLGRS